MSFPVSLISAYISDRYHCRGFVTMFTCTLCVIGFAMYLGSCRLKIKADHHLTTPIFLGSDSNKVKYGSLFLSITGTYCAAPALSTWSANNAAPHARRATAIAIGFIMTNSGGILATWLLGKLSPPPLYTKATIILLIFSVLMVVFAGLNTYYLWTQNKKKAAIRATMSRSDENPGLGDRSAWFVYNL
jgi:MFS family permease